MGDWLVTGDVRVVIDWHASGCDIGEIVRNGAVATCCPGRELVNANATIADPSIARESPIPD
jgi:hypothetical protein